MTTTVTADPDWDGTWDEAYVEEDLNDETNYYTANDEMDFTDETYLEVEQNFEEAYATYLDARKADGSLEGESWIFPCGRPDSGRIYGWDPNFQISEDSEVKRSWEVQAKRQGQEQDQHLGDQGWPDPSTGQRHEMPQVWPSWTLGSKLPSEWHYAIFTYITAEPYIDSYLITFEEGKD